MSPRERGIIVGGSWPGVRHFLAEFDSASGDVRRVASFILDKCFHPLIVYFAKAIEAFDVDVLATLGIRRENIAAVHLRTDSPSMSILRDAIPGQHAGKGNVYFAKLIQANIGDHGVSHDFLNGIGARFGPQIAKCAPRTSINGRHDFEEPVLPRELVRFVRRLFG